MGKREEQKAERKYAIMFTGLDLFVRRGYNATKITDIAKELNISVGLLFHYFESKEKLYEELVRLGISGPQGLLELKMDPEHPLDFFEQAARLILKNLKEPVVTKMFVLMSQAAMNDAAPQIVKELVSQINSVEMAIPLIEAGQKQGVIKEGNPRALSLAFWGCIQGIAEELAVNPETPIPEADWIVDILRKHS